MTDAVYVDTSALYALMDSSDARHADAVGVFPRLALRPLQITSYTLVESLALIQSRLGLPATLEFQAAVVPCLSVYWVDEAFHARAVERLARLSRREVSLVDCSAFLLMEDRDIREAFAFDDDFRREGFQLLP